MSPFSCFAVDAIANDEPRGKLEGRERIVADKLPGHPTTDRTLIHALLSADYLFLFSTSSTVNSFDLASTVYLLAVVT